MPEDGGVNSHFREWNASGDVPPDQEHMLLSISPKQFIEGMSRKG